MTAHGKMLRSPLVTLHEHTVHLTEQSELLSKEDDAGRPFISLEPFMLPPLTVQWFSLTQELKP